jgi:hypothetical protein
MFRGAFAMQTVEEEELDGEAKQDCVKMDESDASATLTSCAQYKSARDGREQKK